MNKMKDPFALIVISSTDGFEHEIRHVEKMFEEGLELFHLRKPKFSTGRLKKYIEKIDSKYYPKIVIHSHHELSVPFQLRGIHFTRKHFGKKYFFSWLRLRYIKFRRKQFTVSTGFHTLSDLKDHNKDYDYVFLSPVFESISKVGYSGKFNEDSVRETLAKTSHKVIALGGVTEEKIEHAMEMGFSGVAVLGSIWKSKDPVETFKQLQARCKQLVNM